MKKLLMGLTLGVGLLFITGCGCRHTDAPFVESEGITKDDVLWYMNSHRTQPLVRDAKLDAAAQGHAEWMAKNGKMSHTQGWFGSGPADRVTAAGYRWRGVAENVAYGQRSEKEVVTAWYNSSGHRRNMQGNYRHTGIGFAYGKNGLIYWVTVFANPA